MGNNIKLAFFDIDGTLVNKSGGISDEDLESLSRLKKEGIKIAIASGRSITAIASLNAQIQFDAACSLASGAVIFDPVAPGVMHLANLKNETLKRVWLDLKRNNFYAEAHTVDTTFIVASHPFAAIHSEYMDIAQVIIPEQQILGHLGVLKIVVMVDTATELSRVLALLDQHPGLACSVATAAKHPWFFFVNITDTEADKKKTFFKILQIEKVTAAEVISFGDSDSDKIFIEQAGIGVAMADAPDAVKACAQMVTASVEDSGVSKALKQLVFDRL